MKHIIMKTITFCYNRKRIWYTR